MLYNTLDGIVRGVLLNEGKSVHDYLRYLKYAVDGVKFLSTHTPKITSTIFHSVELDVSDYKSAPLPCDYVDYIKVAIRVGERLRPLIMDESLERLYNNETGTREPWPTTLVTNEDQIPGIYPYLYDTPQFNLSVDRGDYRFLVIPERDEIQLSANYPFSTVVLQYVSDGLDSDAATQVNPLAEGTIRAYIQWQFKHNSRTAGIGEKQSAKLEFEHQHRLLRSAIMGLTKEEIIHAMRSGYSPLPPHN